jgi:hypothetical protein
LYDMYDMIIFRSRSVGANSVVYNAESFSIDRDIVLTLLTRLLC